MRKQIPGWAFVAGIALLTTGCYNDPERSERAPGTGTEPIHSKPQVGPGTTAGGSTAGPQPKVERHTETEPTSQTAKPESEHEHPPEPAKQH